MKSLFHDISRIIIRLIFRLCYNICEVRKMELRHITSDVLSTSITDLTRNTPSIIKNARNIKKIIVFKNNQPTVVLYDFEKDREREEMIERLEKENRALRLEKSLYALNSTPQTISTDEDFFEYLSELEDEEG